MKKNKILFLLTICLLFTFSCDNLIQSQKYGDCYVSLSIGGVSGRTIMPSPENINFSRYELIFTPTGDTKGKTITEKWLNGKSSGAVSLSAGTYYLVVTAYMDDSEEPDAQKCREITVIAGQKNEINVNLDIINKLGTGTFSWNITYAVEITGANMTITPLSDNTEIIVPFEIVVEEESYIPNPNIDSLDLKTGYYRVVINLIDSNAQIAEFNEILHIYNGMESVLEYEFTNVHFTSGTFFVTTEEDFIPSGNNKIPQGSLRWALEQAMAGTNSTIIVDSRKVKEIKLKSPLLIELNYGEKYFFIEGNGVIITSDNSFNNAFFDFRHSLTSSLLNITICRVHFKNGQGFRGGVIFNSANLTLESCIFSDNKADDGNGSGNGGAINSSGNMNITGCTFYNNSAAQEGGAIITTGTLNLKGNLFYGNKAEKNGAVVSGSGVISLGFNIVDVKFLTGQVPDSDTDGNNNCGWIKETGDKYIDSPIITSNTFNLLDNRANILPDIIENYPTIDFYGYPIKAGGAAGAVQEKAQ